MCGPTLNDDPIWLLPWKLWKSIVGSWKLMPPIFRGYLKLWECNSVILLLEEILHHLGCIKPPCKWDIYHINWCRISSHQSVCFNPVETYQLDNEFPQCPVAPGTTWIGQSHPVTKVLSRISRVWDTQRGGVDVVFFHGNLRYPPNPPAPNKALLRDYENPLVSLN